MDEEVDPSDRVEPVGFAGRLEVVSGPTGRRSWPDATKARIVHESQAPGVSVNEVARRHRISPQQLTGWRRAARDGHLVLDAADAVPSDPGFVPLTVVADDSDGTSRQDGRIEIEVDGLVVRLPAGLSVERIADLVFALGARR